MAVKKELNKVSRWEYANDADQPQGWLVIEGEATAGAVQAGKSRVVAQFEHEDEADAFMAED